MHRIFIFAEETFPAHNWENIYNKLGFNFYFILYIKKFSDSVLK